jgi:ubiquinone/menaquinone biosynthesis C-methylase UbiE
MGTTRTPYDNIARRYDSVRVALKTRELEYLHTILSSLAPQSTILDLGCGTGRPMATTLAARGHLIVGVDESQEMLALARQRLPGHRWIHGRIEEIELNELFHAVICWDSLFHLPREHWPGVLEKIVTWLKLGGALLLSSGGVVEGDHGFYDTMFDQEFYYDSLPSETLVPLLKNLGFRIIVSEMCELPDGGRNKGKLVTIASRTR